MRDEASAAEVHGDEHDGEQDHDAADRVYPARCRRDVALWLTRLGHLRLPCSAFDRARRPVSQPGFEPGTKGLKVLCSTVELLARLSPVPAPTPSAPAPGGPAARSGKARPRLTSLVSRSLSAARTSSHRGASRSAR